MARNWKEFDDPGTPRLAEMHVSLSPSGTMMLSKNAHAALGEPTHVVMLWDAETSTIGLRPVPPPTLNAFRLYPTNRSGAFRLHALRFITKHDLKLEHTVRFPDATIEDGVLALELATRVRSPRHVRPIEPRKGYGQAEA